MPAAVSVKWSALAHTTFCEIAPKGVRDGSLSCFSTAWASSSECVRISSRSPGSPVPSSSKSRLRIAFRLQSGRWLVTAYQHPTSHS